MSDASQGSPVAPRVAVYPERYGELSPIAMPFRMIGGPGIDCRVVLPVFRFPFMLREVQWTTCLDGSRLYRRGASLTSVLVGHRNLIMQDGSQVGLWSPFRLPAACRAPIKPGEQVTLTFEFLTLLTLRGVLHGHIVELPRGPHP